MRLCNRQLGFTLIEALIAFLILSVGILGALLFHSNILKSSAENKEKLEAMAFAERWAEDIRNRRFSTESAFDSYLSSDVSGAVVSAPGQLNSYGLRVNNLEPVSGASSTYSIEYEIYWPFASPANSMTFATYLGWIDPTALIDPDNTGTTSGTEYDGDIPIPTGTLSEVPRIELADVSEVTSNAVAGRSTDTVKVYQQDGQQAKVAVKIDDNTYVQLAELTESDNEIFTITGRIYINTDDYRVERGFGPVYGVTESNLDSLLIGEESSGSLVEGVDYYQYGTDADPRYFRNNVIDIRASAGANCIIGRYSNAEAVETRIRGRLYEVNYGRWADYICVAGTGWNGTIKPYFRNFDGDTLAEIVVGDLNCVPSVRGFRYLILESEQPQRLKDKFETYTAWSSNTVASILETTSSSIVGQSGFVRFYDDTTDYAASDESVHWNQYFWHNPNYIINPSHTEGASFAHTSSLVGPELTGDFHSQGRTLFAVDGYKSPKVTNTSSPSNYEMSLPGDVTHQNFYISSSGNGGGVLNDCDDVLDNILPNLKDQDLYLDNGANFTTHYYLASHGVPGYEVDPSASAIRGYVPPADSHNFDAADFNRMVVSGEPENTGVLILGYTLATESLSGTLSYPASVALGSNQYTLGGGPSPVISINCSTGSTVASGAFAYVDYSCAVPNYWTGEIFAYDSSGETSVCNNPAIPETYLTDENGVTLTEVDESSISSVASPSVQYYYNDVIGPGTASEASFSALGLYPIETPAADLVTKDGFDFKFEYSGSGNCPP